MIMLRKESNEVYYCQEEKIFFSQKNFDQLLNLARGNESGKCRYCIHKSHEDTVHKMLIGFIKQKFQPVEHYHKQKEETFIVLKGELEIFLYDNLGNETDCYKLSGLKPSLLHIEKEQRHKIMLVSSEVVILEICNGPYNSKDLIEV